jgi:indole-3-glycerol phosphate synthase
VINEGISPAEIARLYTEGGAQAISVLTEEKYFGGQLDFVQEIAKHTTLPLLRKDFLFDELQVRQTATTPASALLLIVALTPEVSQLRDLRQLAESFGIEAVVEIFNEAERWIAASGIDSHEALMRLHGYDAALIGSALMSDQNPKQALQAIISK